MQLALQVVRSLPQLVPAMPISLFGRLGEEKRRRELQAAIAERERRERVATQRLARLIHSTSGVRLTECEQSSTLSRLRACLAGLAVSQDALARAWFAKLDQARRGLLEAMGRYNEELGQAGMLLGMQGLKPSAQGVRVQFTPSGPRLLDGPFAETKELVAGFWMWRAPSLQAALDWARRCPMQPGAEIEVRPVYEADDLGADFTPELRAQEERLVKEAQARDQEGAQGLAPVPPARGALAYLVAKDAARAIEWYREHLGAEVVFRLDAPNGGVMHSELRVGPAHFMLTDECAEQQALGPLALGGTSVSLVLYVPDVDAVVAKAIAGGAKPGMPVADQFWGDRSGTVTDPFGHSWFISSRKEEPTPEEIQRRVQALYAQHGQQAG